MVLAGLMFAFGQRRSLILPGQRVFSMASFSVQMWRSGLPSSLVRTTAVVREPPPEIPKSQLPYKRSVTDQYVSHGFYLGLVSATMFSWENDVHMVVANNVHHGSCDWSFPTLLLHTRLFQGKACVEPSFQQCRVKLECYKGTRIV